MPPLGISPTRPGRRQRILARFLTGALLVSGLATGFQAKAVDPPTTPGSGFKLIASDLEFILEQIKIAEAHAAGGQLFGPGPNQVGSPLLPFGLRTVSGELNNGISGQEEFGSSDNVFPRLTTPVFRPAEEFDPDGPGSAPAMATSYAQTKGVVVDSQPRIISNLIADQTGNNPAAVAAAAGTPGSEAIDHDNDPATPDLFFIPNVAPDVGLSAPYNSWFTFFGQFFDHGLDLVNKGGSGVVFVPLQPDDPLYVPGSPTNFMVLTRATNLPGPDGVLGDDPSTPSVDESADDIHEATNQTSPFVDQNQTYTSHPSHQVFLRQYELDAGGKPVSTGKMHDGAAGGVSNWGEIKAQAATLLGIQLSDQDVLNIPLLATDPYGRFLRGANGYAQLVTPGGLVEGNPAANGGLGVPTAGAVRTGHAFLDDIAHHAVPFGDHDNNPSTPRQALTPDADPGTADDGNPATYDDELLAAHFITGDGRGNENIALTAVHHVFHGEHNRLVGDIKDLITSDPRLDFVAEWHLADGSWNGERIFQAAKFVTEMEYQHLVFEEFARKMQPQVNIFTGHHTDINPAILAEFAHATFRLGHTMLPQTVARTNADGSTNDVSLVEAFLNPLEFHDGGTAGPLTPRQATGAVIRGLTRQVGNEIDEFVTDAVRNDLLGLPLDLAAINLARGRDTGIPPLNAARRQFFAATSMSALRPYKSWVDYGFALRHRASLVNFVAAYGTHESVTGATTLAGKRAAASLLVNCNPGAGSPGDCGDFMHSTGTWASGPGGVTTTGLDNVDFWVGGIAEKQMVFGGLLGPTLNYVFETQMERLQDGDRLYYLSRLAGLNLLTQLEENSFAEMAMRNSDTTHLPLDVFSRPDMTFEVANLGTSGPIPDDPSTPDWDESALLTRTPDGTIRFAGEEHVLWGGTAGADHIRSSEGDDTIWGDGGDDRLEGGDGNDQIHAGDGDDIVTDLFGDDNLKGGHGHDAINGGQGFDLILGGFGQDFIVGGDDPKEEFGGPGDDFIIAGNAADEMFGNEGDDWIEGGNGADLLQGDNGFPFQDDPNGGNDVIIGGGGNDDYDSEGGDDIMVSDPGIERNEGMLGFDWVTHKDDPQPGNSDLRLVGLLPPDIEDIRDRFDLVEALSGWDFDDVLRGDSRLAADMIGHELTNFGLIDGLQDLVGPGVTVFTNGNIIIGGGGSDLIEGRGGDDLIDGDAWLNVRISVRDPNNLDVELQTVKSMTQIQAAVFAGTINPGQLRIVREILTAGAGAAIDTAVFSGLRSEYVVFANGDGTTTVAHVGGTQADGTDRLRNIEQLRFADETIATPTDTEAPSMPTNVVATAVGPSQIDVTWNPSTDNVGVAGYEVFRDGAATPIATVTGTSFSDTGLAPSSTHTYTVVAFDAAGNRSATSAPASAMTPPPPPPGTTVTVDPTAIDFGARRVGQNRTRRVTLSNTGPNPLVLSGTAFTGANPGDFTVTASTCTGPIAPGRSCRLSVTFTPTAVGDRAATLVISSNAGTSSVSLTGTGRGPSGSSGSGATVGAGRPTPFRLAVRI